MKMTITNTSKADQGVHTAEGLVFIAPGKTRTVDVREDYVRRVHALPFLHVAAKSGLDLDDKGGPGGSTDELDKLTVPNLKALAEAEGVDLREATKSADIKAAIRAARLAASAAPVEATEEPEAEQVEE